MPHTKLLFRKAAREKVPRGASQLADAIRVTLGPKSKSVLIQRKWGPMTEIPGKDEPEHAPPLPGME